MHLVIRGALALSLVLGASPARAAQSKQPRVMVLDLPAVRGIEPATLKTLDDFLAGAVRDQGFEIITPSQIGAVLGLDRQRQLLGCAESSCLAELGGAMGADYIVLGNIAVLESSFAVSLSAVNQKGIAVGAQRRLVKGTAVQGLLAAFEEMVPKLMTDARAGGAKPNVADAHAGDSKPNLTATPKVPPTPAGGLEASAPPEGHPTGSYVLLAVGTAALVASAVVGVMAHSSENTLQSDIQNAQSSKVVSDDRSAVHNRAVISTVLTGVGIVAAGAGGAWWIAGAPATEGSP
ncbi:MAG: hypothetical protein JST54_15365 [Deltaproteobacteria bacterium]|nr:hypothetical protein [Deltaproteobacteria bacterium]